MNCDFITNPVKYLEPEQQEKQKIYIMLSMTGTRFARMLKCFTRSPYTHVSISLDRDLREMYSFGRWKMHLPMFAGFVQEIPDRGVFQKYDVSCAIYELEVSCEQYLKIEHMINRFWEGYDRYKYNFAGLPFMLFRIPLCRKHRFVCSQFVAYLLSRSEIAEFEQGYTLVQPEDFLQLDMKKIFQGSLRDYCEMEKQEEAVTLPMQQMMRTC